MAEKAVVTQATLDAIGQAIIDKGGATAPMTPAQMPAAIAAIPSGGGEVQSSPNDVNFRMPDGKIVKSYTAEEFASLTDLPEQPSIGGLTAQGWNWSLSDAKTYVASYGKLEIGGMYTTDNGETRLYITIAEPYRLTQPLCFGRTYSGQISVDWGDGSEPVIYTHAVVNVVYHTYPGAGDYVIRMSSVGAAKIIFANTGYNIFGSTENSVTVPSRVFSSRLRKVEFGSNVEIGSYLFEYCSELSCVTISNKIDAIRNYAFAFCTALSHVTIPSSVVRILTYAFNGCTALSSVSIPCSVNFNENYVLYNCGSLLTASIPPSFTSIGTNFFRSCSSLSSVVIPSSISVISGNMFYYCYSLTSVTFPPSVTTIESQAFYNCKGVAKYDFTSSTSVPTLSNKSAFNTLAPDCKIVVPDNLYADWIAGTNWSDSSIVSHIVKESEYTPE